MPSALEKLQKIIRLEQSRGYDNRAVVGGLAALLPHWIPEAEQDGVDALRIAELRQILDAYEATSGSDRPAALQRVMDLLGEEPSPPPPPGERVPAPSQTQSSPPQATSAPNGGAETHTPGQEGTPSGEPTPPPTPLRKPPGLSASLTVIRGIGERNGKALTRLGLHTLEDLLTYYPRRYDDYSQLKPINRLQYGEDVTVIGMIQSINSRQIRSGKSSLTEAILTDSTASLRLSWFNQPWIYNNFKKGDQVVVSGRLERYKGLQVMNSPEMEQIERDHLHTNRIVPVYPLTAGISQKMLRRWIYQAVSFWAPRLPDFLPEDLRSSVKLLDLSTAIQQTHFPDSQDLLDLARWRLAFDEILLLQLGVMSQKRAWQAARGEKIIAPAGWRAEFESLLPFPLTNAQQQAISDILEDFASGRPMDRLLQGDVGSGKTAVAAAAAALVMQSGGQTAIMAPTSILAEQHYQGFTRLLCSPAKDHPAPFKPEEIRLLIGDTSAAEKRSIQEGLSSGMVKLVIGTHALIEDPIALDNLRLVVIDEQHRFGVEQRALLRSKGSNPHLLVMTATPIPRSLALTVYGDLELSVMDEMPPGRQPITTHIIHPQERERAYQLVRREADRGFQTFIIYPLVEESEKDEGLAAVEDHERLQKEVFPEYKLGLLHGRLKPDVKEDVMRRFRDREFDILVSTSVVEVGVDIPNATVMLVEGANRFGLAQLHQFRGRVGRGTQPSYCLLIPDSDEALVNQRLLAMEETSDGFVLAERDLDQRGPGDFLGTRQAGFSELRMAKLTDIHLIEKARNQAKIIFQEDPDLLLPKHAALSERLRTFWTPGQGDVS